MKVAGPQVTPKSLGYRMPAEWAPHEGTWLSWPTNPLTWPDRLEKAETAYISMIHSLARHEKVFLLVDSNRSETRIRHQLSNQSVLMENVEFHLIPTVDSWIRDYGPNFLLGSGGDKLPPVAFNHWDFNAWGEKYDDLLEDRHISVAIEALLQIPVFRPGIILEGGSIDVNGEGLCLTTEQCLLHPNRNSQLAKEQIEEYLRDYLGVEDVIWLGEGIVGDDTDGHVDDIARFTSPDTIICAVEEEPADPNFAALQSNLQKLEEFGSRRGIRIVQLPMPDPVYAHYDRLPASYLNFYIANAVVLVPVFGQHGDSLAISILEGLFPDREVIGIDCSDLIWGMGAVHCLTQQQPSL